MHNRRVNNPSDAQRPQPRRSSSRRRRGARQVSGSPQDARDRRKASQARAQAAREAAAREASRQEQASGAAANRSAQASANSRRESTEQSAHRFVDEKHGERRRTAAATASLHKGEEPKGALASRWALWKPHVKRFAGPLLINYGVTLGIIVALAVVVGIGAGFRRVPATIGSLWMVVNLGTLNMTGALLGFLPLAPALIYIWATARRTTKIIGKSVSVRGLRVFIVLSLLIPLLMTLLAWFMLWDASKVFDLAAPNVGEALVSTALVNGAAVVIGLRSRIWRALLLRRELPTWPVEAFRLAASFLLWMMVAGGVVALVYAATNMGAVVDSYGITSSLTGAIGLSLLALLYLPNIAIGAMAVLLGGEFHVGDGAVSLFTSTNVNLPPLPILAAVPNQTIPGGPFFLAVTALVAVATVYRFVKTRGFIEAPVALAVGSGAAVAFLGFCLSWLAGGELGVYGSAGALEWLFAAECAAWLMVPALVFMLYVSRAGAVVVEDVEDSSSTPTSTDSEEDRPEESEDQGDQDDRNKHVTQDEQNDQTEGAEDDEAPEGDEDPETTEDTEDTEDEDSSVKQESDEASTAESEVDTSDKPDRTEESEQTLESEQEESTGEQDDDRE